MQKEIWKDIPEFEGLYQVSNLGRIKSFKLNKETILKPVIKYTGYSQISLVKNGVTYAKRIHQLVVLAFLNHKPNVKIDLVIDHINNVKSDNRLENLQIITNRENLSKDVKNKTSKYTGVCWDKQSKKWHSTISYNKKRYHLGFFKCELKAHYIYLKNLKMFTNDIKF